MSVDKLKRIHKLNHRTNRRSTVTEIPILKQAVQETRDYDQFGTVLGNRLVDPLQVRYLKKKMTLYGNLTPHFPIIVNEKMEIIDGQHRLQALRELEWAVFYRVQPHLTVETVRGINQAAKNWTWLDFAVSYSELGNENYTRFINLYTHFGYSFGTLSAFVGMKDAKKGGPNKFKEGEFTFSIEKHKKAFELLKKYQEVREQLEHSTTNVFARALKNIMDSPNYNQERMVKKMHKFGYSLKSYRSEVDTMRAIEDIYNMYVRDDKKIRLF